MLGLGNSGNAASLEAVLHYLRRDHPDASLDAMTAGFRHVHEVYGLETIPLAWYEQHGTGGSGLPDLGRKVIGKILDPIRIVAWVRRHDVVIVPGMGVLEATLPLRAYGFPVYMYLLSVAGKIGGSKVALVSVGANEIRQRATRWLLVSCAKLAYHRSYRDEYSRTALQRAGVNTARDHVFPDLAFSLPTPDYDPGDPRLVGIGVMEYYGGNDDRARADEIHSAYFENMTSFVCWLLEHGYSVRFFGGDDACDYEIADQIMAAVSERCRDQDPAARMVAEPFPSYADMLREMNRASIVVATRFHNVLGALKLGKPTIAIGYSDKFTALMDSMDLAEFTQHAREVSAGKLIEQFEEIQRRGADLVPGIMKRNADNADRLAEQFAVLTASLFSSRQPGA
jgi:polysaccharide pyruvyl transferase WcaK-like protein